MWVAFFVTENSFTQVHPSSVVVYPSAWQPPPCMQQHLTLSRLEIHKTRATSASQPGRPEPDRTAPQRPADRQTLVLIREVQYFFDTIKSIVTSEWLISRGAIYKFEIPGESSCAKVLI